MNGIIPQVVIYAVSIEHTYTVGPCVVIQIVASDGLCGRVLASGEAFDSMFVRFLAYSKWQRDTTKDYITALSCPYCLIANIRVDADLRNGSRMVAPNCYPSHRTELTEVNSNILSELWWLRRAQRAYSTRFVWYRLSRLFHKLVVCDNCWKRWQARVVISETKYRWQRSLRWRPLSIGDMYSGELIDTLLINSVLDNTLPNATAQCSRDAFPR